MGRRYEVVDGLRGTAAVAVMAMHLASIFRPDAASNPLHHGYLAVDFFFMLSGFVIGHAYDGRWARMSRRAFVLRRVLRLQPVAVLGALLAAGVYALSRKLDGAGVAWGFLAGDLALALLVLPAPSLPGLSGMTHSLNIPAWSLTQEYLASFAYALVGPRLGPRSLTALVAAFGAAVLATAASHPNLDLGWNWPSLWAAPIRSGFGFFAGLLLQRAGARLSAPGGWLSLSLVLLACLAAPTLRHGNGLLDAALVIGVFPLLIAAGAGSESRGVLGWLCERGGEASYPLYLIHQPLLEIYAGWVWRNGAPHAVLLAVGAALGPALLVLAWTVFRVYDVPVRARLGALLGRDAGQPAHAPSPIASPG